MSRYRCLAGLGLVWLLSGCVDPSAVGFHLPDGDADRGRAAFVELQCSACHTLSGVDLPAPVAEPPVGVELGVVLRKRTAGELVTSIIDPTHNVSPSRTGGTVLVGGRSRMANYADLMTVRQLADLVAFLRANQRVEEPASRY